MYSCISLSVSHINSPQQIWLNLIHFKICLTSEYYRYITKYLIFQYFIVFHKLDKSMLVYLSFVRREGTLHCKWNRYIKFYFFVIYYSLIHYHWALLFKFDCLQCPNWLANKFNLEGDIFIFPHCQLISDLVYGTEVK